MFKLYHRSLDQHVPKYGYIKKNLVILIMIPCLSIAMLVVIFSTSGNGLVLGNGWLVDILLNTLDNSKVNQLQILTAQIDISILLVVI